MGKIKQYIKNFIKYLRAGGKYEGTPIVKVGVSYTLPNERFKGKKVLVTGGGTGIGLAIAKAFLDEGAEVMIVGRRLTVLDDVKKQLDNDRLHTMVWDIADIQRMEKNFETALNIMSNFDVFVNNAGVYEDVRYDDCREDVYDQILSVNTKALYYILSQQAKYATANHVPCHIINITSIDGICAYANPYSISKWGANGITRAFAKELVKYGITVNGIAPGPVVTDILHDAGRIDVMENAYKASNPSGRYTLVEEVAALALFLASGATNNIIGQIIAIDGGRTIL